MLPSTLLLLLALSLTSSTHAYLFSARNPPPIPVFPRSPGPEARPAPPPAPAPAARPPPPPAPRPPPAPAPRPPTLPAPRPDDPEIPDALEDSGATSRRLNGPSTTTGSSTVRFLRGGTSTATAGSPTRTADAVTRAGAGAKNWVDERFVIVISVVVVAFA